MRSDAPAAGSRCRTCRRVSIVWRSRPRTRWATSGPPRTDGSGSYGPRGLDHVGAGSPVRQPDRELRPGVQRGTDTLPLPAGSWAPDAMLHRPLDQWGPRRRPHLDGLVAGRGDEPLRPAKYRWTVDATAPQLVILGGPQADVNTTSPHGHVQDRGQRARTAVLLAGRCGVRAVQLAEALHGARRRHAHVPGVRNGSRRQQVDADLAQLDHLLAVTPARRRAGRA